MTRDNQLSIDHHHGKYLCHSCDRTFSTLIGAINHCQFAAIHTGEWCQRCEWLFISPVARESHEENSSLVTTYVVVAASTSLLLINSRTTMSTSIINARTAGENSSMSTILNSTNEFICRKT
ncbi:hypothetical protein A1O1_05252 [Capronia coronata CBS 617.96]|uniref:C2H2-type domain-containing protein n=1 Tax=Capronia coronata CBS 617.96 TaxID=1182541 RepID=W9Y667_9EURO|nr:uncharacterized protein A1O1_05252 [Capronia coronata CBS 617.96]EXJ88322.1 hypothetical protein A1O1_05252 [Capronia coronata CBS 617.96]